MVYVFSIHIVKNNLRGNESCVINDTLFLSRRKRKYIMSFSNTGEISQSEEVLRVIFNCAQRVYHDIIL